VAAAEVLGQVGDLAAADGYLGAVAARPLDRGQYPLLLRGADHRSDKGFRRNGITDRNRGVCGGDGGERVVEQRPVDEHAGGRRARLARVHAHSDRGTQDR